MGDGIRTRDIQIHNLRPDRHKAGSENGLGPSMVELSHPMPTDNRRLPPDLAVVVAAWPSLPEAIKAGIMAMVRSTHSGC